jgi:PD-(D/E)XK endonuclease
MNTNIKGNVAELKIQAELANLGVPVLTPVTEHERYDLVVQIEGRFLRIQCKWAPLYRGVVCVRNESNRRAAGGFIRRPYTSSEVDAIAAYCEDLDRCFLIPIDVVGSSRQFTLRLEPTRNGQKACLNWAADYELSGAIAQLGERLHGMQEVVGSSPTSSTSPETHLGAHEYRQKMGWYMERAAAGETFLITRRGKPYARISPPHEQLIEPPAGPRLEVVQ